MDVTHQRQARRTVWHPAGRPCRRPVLLPLLSGDETHGLPSVVVIRVAFQRGSFNQPMEDVIVTGHDLRDSQNTREIQTKRTIAFTANNSVFADVVALDCQADAKPEFRNTRHEFAIAIARTSTKIEQHVQSVLTWAHEYQGADGFFQRLNQPGTALGYA